MTAIHTYRWMWSEENDHDGGQWRTIPEPQRAGTIRWSQFIRWSREDGRRRTWRLEDTIMTSTDVLMSMKVFPTADRPRRKTSAYVPFQIRQKRWAWIRTKEHHLTRLWPWRSKREQKNEGRDKWNWRERWNCESLWFSVSIELKHGTKGSLLGWCLVHQFVNQDDISGVKIMTRHQIWHASPDMTVTWDSSAKGDTGLLMPPKTMWRDSRVNETLRIWTNKNV